jgi:ABC-type Na+ transport system ATPase subunit NatA
LSDELLLEADAARIDVSGQALLSELSARSSASRLALLGDWSGLFRLLAGEAELTSGVLRIGGAAVPDAVRRGSVGLMRLDPLLPASWRAERFLTSSAELAGWTKKAARRASSATLERLGLTSLASQRLNHLRLAERRALLLAHALLTEPRVVCLEQPLRGLDSSAEHWLLTVLERAPADCRLIIAIAEPELSAGGRQLSQSCGERLRLIAGAVVTEPAEAAARRRVTATVCRNHQAFANALRKRGLSARATHEAGLLHLLTSADAGPAWRYLVELKDDSTAGVLDAALEVEAGLLELIPV